MKTSILKTLLSLFCLGFITLSFSQTVSDPVLMTIGNSNVTKSEFLTIYQKNNVKGEVIDKKSLDEYLELFINFKLKVKEAEELGLDTVGSFKTELNGYRKQLAQNYLNDNEVNDELLNEAYERMKKDIRASHILIKVDPGASAKDTLAAYNKIMALRNRIMKGEKFETVAKEASDDPSAKDREASGSKSFVKGNGGDLGYFTVFDMVYPFENVAYKTKLNEVSMPVRTEYGYHIVKVTDIKNAMGRVHVAHIFLAYPQKGTAEDSLKVKNKIFEAYSKLKQGIDWDTVAKQYSEDKSTAAKGGVLPWFGVNRMVPEFITAVSKLNKIGAISEPVSSPFGWHIIKMLERKDIGSFEDSKADMKQKISRDTRSQKSKDAVVAKIKAQYGFKEFTPAVTKFLTVLDSSVFQGKWDVKKAEGLNAKICSIGDKIETQQDFARFIAKDERARTPEDMAMYLDGVFKKFTEETCLNYKDSKLESEFPDFRNLMKEYRDGILLFDLTDQKVWTKAIKDTVGLEEFYSKNKSNYMWGERLEAAIYKSKDKEAIKQAHRLAEEGLKKDYSEESILKAINKDTLELLRIEHNKFSKGDNKLIDKIAWQRGISDISEADGSSVFIVALQKLGPEPKTLSEARGLVTADYQNQLEKLWIKGLREKYPVKVNQEVFSTIK